MAKCLFILLFFISFMAYGKEYLVNKILEVEVTSSINPATVNYLESSYQKAKVEGYDTLIIKLNTPGGLVSSTKKILTLMGSQNIPTIIWIGPEGASATSAGAIIASGAHFLSMSEGTNIGASTPIQITGEVKNKDLRAKAVNDLVALVKGLSDTRGRNGKFYSEMITKAKSFAARDALKKNIINSIDNDISSLIKSINDKEVNIKGITHKLSLTERPFIQEYKMDLGQQLLNIFSDPNMTYILMLIGAALLYLELQAPGGFIAGSIGAVFLLLAGIGLQILPLNFGALALIILSFFLFVLEAYIISYGIITLIGLVALISGSLFLFRTEDSYLELSLSLILSASSAIAAFILLIAYVFLKDFKKKAKNDFNNLLDKEVEILSFIEITNRGTYLYKVRVNGEIWKAISKEEKELNQTSTVICQNKDNMILEIK